MKKANNTKKNPSLKKTDKVKESGELRKPTKLKPLKEKEKKNWKASVDDDEDDFAIDDTDLKIDGGFDDTMEEEEDDGFYDDNY